MIEGVPYTNSVEKATTKAIFDNSLIHFSKYFFSVLRGEEFKLNWHHYYICAILERAYKGLDKNVIINVPPGSGKCDVEGNLILTKQGWIPVQNIKVGDCVYSHDSGNLFKQNVVATETYEKDCVKVTTVSGVELSLSEDHPVLTKEGWKESKDLTYGDYLTLLCSEVDGDLNISTEELYLLYHLIFNSTIYSDLIEFNPLFCEDSYILIKALRDFRIPFYERENRYIVVYRKNNNIEKIFDKYNFTIKDNKISRLPSKLYNLSLNERYTFIGILFYYNGLPQRPSNFYLYFDKVSIVEDIKRLLMMCNVHSSLFDIEYDVCFSYVLEVQYSYLKYILSKIKEALRSKDFLSYFSEYYEGYTLSGADIDTCDTNSFVYDKVVSIKTIGRKKVYHLQVEATDYDLQNYIANGIVVHNTSLVTTLYVAWCYSKSPHSRFLTTSYNDELIESCSQAVKDIINSPQFDDLYSGYSFKLDNNKKNAWILQHNGKDTGEYYCASIRGGITGKRGGYMVRGFSGALILDDVNKPADCVSEAKRNEAFSLVYNTVRSRKANSNVPMIVVQQRLDVADVTGMLLDKAKADNWVVYKIPALVDKSYLDSLPEWLYDLAAPVILPYINEYGVSSYWPEKESLDELLAIREVDPFTFNAQYMQEPSSKSGNLINTSWFKYYDSVPEKLDSVSIFMDTAVGVKNYNDYSVMLAVGESGGNMYLLDLMRGRFEMPQLIQNAKEFCSSVTSKYKNTTLSGVFVEFKSSGQGLAQTLKQETRLPIIDIHPKGDKVLRCNQVLPYIEAGRVFIPRSASWVDSFIYECSCFSPNMSHKHDDQVDCLVYALTRCFLDKIKARVHRLIY